MGRLTRVLGVLIRLGLGSCALFLVLTALYVSVGRQLVPLVAEYRSEIETKARAALDMPLSIGSLEGRWSGFAPVLLAHDVIVGDGANALRLDHVRAVPDLWASLVAHEVRIAHLELDGLQLSLKEDNEGHWALQGLPVKDDKPLDPEQMLTQIKAVARLSLLDSQVTLQPYGQPPLTFTYLSFTLETAGDNQRLDARLTLPDGQPMALNLRSRVQPQNWRDGEAQAYMSLPQSDWAHWLPASLTQQWKLSSLKAGGELWLTWGKGMLQSAVARVNAPQFIGAYADRKPAKISNLAVNAWFRRKETGFTLSLESLAMNIGDKRWESRIQLKQQAATADNDERWHVQADRLDLTPITPILDSLAPLPDQLMVVLDNLKVTGGVRNVLLDYRPQATDDTRFSFAANLDKVGFNAYHGAPAAGNVSGSISGDLGQGELRLDTDDFMLYLYPIFAKPWQYQKANARLTWKLDKQGFTLIAPYIKVLGDEGKIASDFLIRLHFDSPLEDYMDLRVGLVDGDGRYTGKYLPAVLSPALDEWLRTSILGGVVDQGYFQYQGSLQHDAVDAARNISLFFKVHDASLAFQPGWPQLSGVDGKVFVDGAGVRIKASKGTLLNTQVSNVLVNIPHAAAGKNSHLLVDSDFAGDLADGVKILQEAPIGTADTFAGWQGDGPLQGKLKLDIPLGKGEEPKVLVDFDTDGSRLRLANPSLDLTQLKGSFRFDNTKGLSGNNIRAQAFEHSVTAQIFAEGKPGAITTRIAASGQVGQKRLAEWLGDSQPMPVSGDMPFQLQVTLGGANSQLQIDSNLKGLAVDLPAPFGKGADESRDSQFRMNLQGPERRFWVTYGDLANLAFASPAGKMAQGRGELFLGKGGAVVPDAKGLRVRGELSELDVAPWKSVVDRYAGNDPGGSAKQLLSNADLQIGKLSALGSTLENVSVQLDRKDAAWAVAVDSSLLKGSASLPDAKTAPIAIDLLYVKLPAADPNAAVVENAPDPLADVDPRSIPAMDIKITQLFQGDQLIGGWSLKARPAPNGTRLSDLSLGLKGMLLQGEGGWEGAPGSTSSWYKGQIDGKNLADVLKAWGFAPSVTSESFELNADGRWPGSPAWVALKRYSGSLDATLRRGQFVEVEGTAQALRVFGLLNFNSIGRRLRLDFSDLLGKGLSYDQVKGLLVASDGVYVTRNPITLTGPSSNLELDGTLDMVKDRVDAKLLVTLPVTNNLPIAALIIGAPAIGGALFLVDKLLGDKVARFASVQYSVQGPVKDPKITFYKPFEKPQ
ncbi:YhdP family protein [Pseudomonas sp. CCI3.2]|uniref:YhdP family protein n=1 Tax=unclassified Pseudomonas TaxID=196821 RepID=UPI002AC94EFE|nr:MULTISPECIES: YhdP family protein [unclassified Pseudomonas]MEB0079444.1 YhdP family protein [Pseudomonas sp. MH10out]MEB0102630.1 YhdP family protein [Pseudomonas sp. CCI3.2]MEB0133484.1 YhdP family protein [Pseudomonas sp. CCI2.4]MEB0159645.1 YhdP family protein [Pseudomonas sp. AH2 (2023)]MEB0168588.1 YhdP family protein [Pseudomonas sp. CCC4.4]